MKTLTNPLIASPIKWSDTLKQFVSNLPTICFSVFDHFVGLALKGLNLINTHPLSKALKSSVYLVYTALLHRDDTGQKYNNSRDKILS